MINYRLPEAWIRYDLLRVAPKLVEAKSAVIALQSIPYQRAWVEALQQIELKREVAGTSRIEGAEFTERELEIALTQTPTDDLLTRSQRQARAAVQTYRWIATIPDARPIDEDLVREIHRHIVRGADDDHCSPGQIRQRDENVNFGTPRHRGAEGGEDCRLALASLVTAIRGEFRAHDPLVQALAAHYHVAAMHPFLDGNGRTARAIEALMLQRAGLRDTSFIAMSNYYYDEKDAYLSALAGVRAQDHDLTSFLEFGLKGVAMQSQRLLTEIQRHVAKELFRNLMFKLFTRLKTPKRRVIATRQIELLQVLLDVDSMDLESLVVRIANVYKALKNPRKAIVRDLNDLVRLKAIQAEKLPSGVYVLSVRLQWPTEITETAFFEMVRTLPHAKTYSFLQ